MQRFAVGEEVPTYVVDVYRNINILEVLFILLVGYTPENQFVY
jgi:hypothetical protein